VIRPLSSLQKSTSKEEAHAPDASGRRSREGDEMRAEVGEKLAAVERGVIPQQSLARRRACAKEDFKRLIIGRDCFQDMKNVLANGEVQTEPDLPIKATVEGLSSSIILKQGRGRLPQRLGRLPHLRNKPLRN
jgi:hypothetical protein